MHEFFMITVVLFLVLGSLEILIYPECRDTHEKKVDLAWTLFLLVLKKLIKTYVPILTIVWIHSFLILPEFTPLSLLTGWPYYIACLFILEFAFYWEHRFYHHFKIGWTSHVVHHQSRYMNIFAASRSAAIAPWFSLGRFIYVPVFYLGIDINTFVYWILTANFIDTLSHFHKGTSYGFLDKFIISPKNHLIHHAFNKEEKSYNYGGFLMIYDHIFGTYKSDPIPKDAKYGIRSEYGQKKIGNPLLASIKVWLEIFSDTYKYLKNKTSSKPAK